MGKGTGKGKGRGQAFDIDDFSENGGACLACGCGTLFVVAFCLLVLSFSAIEPLQYGLHFSKFSNKIVDEKVREGGLYFIGLGHSFITFPRQAVTIDFANDPTAKNLPLATRTSDGLPVTLEISLQYVLKKENVVDLYTEVSLSPHPTTRMGQ